MWRHRHWTREGQGGAMPHNNLRGGGLTYPLPPSLTPPPPPTQQSTHLFLQFLCETGKNHKFTKLKGKIIRNVTLIWFEGTGKTIPLNSILEVSIISDFKMRNVIIWHWFIKNLVGKLHCYVALTSLRRHVPAGNLPPPQYSKSWPPIF